TAIVTISNEGTSDGHVIVDAVQFIPASEAASLTQPDLATEDDGMAEQLKSVDRELKSLQKQMEELKKGAPPEPPVVIGVEEHKEISDCPLYVRGEIKNVGPNVPRGFLTVLKTGSEPVIGPSTSGRRELAEWIAHPANP